MDDAETHCREVLRNLYRYLDGETAGVECVQFEVHLHRCLPCRDRSTFERELKDLIRRKCRDETVPPGLEERVRDQIRRFLA